MRLKVYDISVVWQIKVGKRKKKKKRFLSFKSYIIFQWCEKINLKPSLECNFTICLNNVQQFNSFYSPLLVHQPNKGLKKRNWSWDWEIKITSFHNFLDYLEILCLQIRSWIELLKERSDCFSPMIYIYPQYQLYNPDTIGTKIREIKCAKMI